MLLTAFFERTDLICDYLPDNTTYLFDSSLADIESSFFLMVQERFQLLTKLGERPILEPSCLYASFEEIKRLSRRINCRFIFPSSKESSSNNITSSVYRHNLSLPISSELDKTLPVLVNSSVKEFGKVLIVIPENKRDVGLAGLKKLNQNTIQLQKWNDFINADGKIYFIFGSLSNGFYSIESPIHCSCFKREEQKAKVPK